MSGEPHAAELFDIILRDIIEPWNDDLGGIQGVL